MNITIIIIKREIDNKSKIVIEEKTNASKLFVFERVYI